jgi:hypothetical protein
MAISAAVKQTRIPGAERVTVTTVTFDNSYLEGGEPLTAKELGLRTVNYAICTMTNGSEEATVRAGDPYYTPATSKIHLIDNATGKEVASTKDMSKVVVQVVAFGK